MSFYIHRSVDLGELLIDTNVSDTISTEMDFSGWRGGFMKISIDGPTTKALSSPAFSSASFSGK